ncbi:MAG: hypothetical protein RL081_1559, partial [Pseudomonadota bacterium]
MAGLVLEFEHAGAHMVQQANGKGVAPFGADVFTVLREIADHLVDAVHPQRGEMVAQRAQVALGVREQAVVHVALDHLALDLQAVAAQLQQGVELFQHARLITF